MDEKADQQRNLARQIKDLLKSFESIAEERKNIKIVEGKINKLEELWSTFETKDMEIRSSFASRKDHRYFTQELFSEVEKCYLRFREDLENRKAMLTAEQEKLKIATQNTPTAPTTFEIGSATNDEDLLFSIRTCRYRIGMMNKFIASIDTAEASQEYMKFKLDRLISDWHGLQEEEVKIYGRTDRPEDFGYDAESVRELDMKVQNVIISLKEKLASGSAVNERQDNNPVKLPTIPIPKFDGDYFKWIQFRDLFSQIIDENSTLKNTEKLWYLKSNLSGEAERIIRHLPVTNENYSVAWKLLNNRYNNERLYVNTILERLINQPAISAVSFKALKQLCDTTRECIMLLTNAGLAVVDSWDPILLFILSKKLDKETHTLYETSLEDSKKMQALNKFLSFVETRFQTLEAIATKPREIKAPIIKSRAATFTTNSSPYMNCCEVCQKSHAIYYCDKFMKLPIKERISRVHKLVLCLNCLKKGHTRNSCQSGGCRKCNQRHHTLLHENVASRAIESSQRKKEQIQPVSSNIGSQERSSKDHYVFLGTARLTVIGMDNKKVSCRALLDSGSQINFITKALQKRLKLDTTSQHLQICGIGRSEIESKNQVSIGIESEVSNYKTNISAQVIAEITSIQPQRFINIDDWDFPDNIKLADPKFNIPKKVDLLLGAEMYGELMRAGHVKIFKDLPMLQNTVLGWIVLGKASQKEPNYRITAGLTYQELNNELQKFWEIEEIDAAKPLSAADIKCEEFFQNTTFRDDEGRFNVNLPILASPEVLGQSKQIAFRRFLNLEKKLSKDLRLKKEYTKFIEEYIELKHMKEIDVCGIPQTHYFLPHHCVIKPESSTTKLRVVFDASCKTTSNLSLNDIMLKGGKVQDDLFSILIRFRTHKYVFTADIKQMYRQIKVAEEDQHLQLIMWRKNPSERLRYYQLTTVTYGTKSASFLATRCLNQLSEEKKINYPLAANIINDFYMDDIITGCNSIFETVKLKNQLIKMLASAKFQLHKWSASHEEILKHVKDEDREKEKIFENQENGYIKTLGHLSWQPALDLFTFTTTWPELDAKITKRRVTSEVARLFDPLGLVNPVVVTAKIFIQALWKLDKDWDEELDENLATEWTKFREQLTTLNSLKIERYIFNANITIRSELHAFADASEKAYGAAIYVRSIDAIGNIKIKLLCAKSKVAPVKIITIPRLELCAAQMAINLMRKVLVSIKTKVDELYYWTDSQIVLAWIQGDASLYKTYVAHRIATIQQRSKPEQWNYINTKSNPADLLSRGTQPESLLDSDLWFRGPRFLMLSEQQWPDRSRSNLGLLDEEKKTVLVTSKVPKANSDIHPVYLINHRNSLNFLLRSLAYVLRATKLMKKDQIKFTRELSTVEINSALTFAIEVVQKEYFKEEIKELGSSLMLKKSNRIASLSPFINQEGILRVGGRLENAEISYSAKHPILLPGDDFLSKLILHHLHNQHLHAGPLALLAISRQKYWIIKGRVLARGTVSNCARCTRIRPQLLSQLMGNLPKERVLPARPFLNTGVDFCGPIYTHYHQRGKRPQKSYIAVFCCFSTKAVHLEMVSDLSTDGFLGALRRFIARRGICKEIFCDNATNFVGAKNRILEVENMLKQQNSKDKITRSCGNQGIQFHFSPPRAPHFGGLWEAAVKSVKKLLGKTLESAALTFEELNTVVAEAEAILNSRPLTPLSSNPNDFTALTPGHFLIGEPLTSIPEPNISQEKLTSLSRWRLVSAIRHYFWKRWSNEYLNQLQEKHKWKEVCPNIQPGQLVIIKEDNISPLKWSMGRIVEGVKGDDGLVRVAKVKTARGVFTREIIKLAPLPVKADIDDTTIEINGANKESNDKGIEVNNPRIEAIDAVKVSNKADRELNNTINDTEEISRKRNSGRPRENIRKRSRMSYNTTTLFLIGLFFLPLIVFGQSTPFKISTIEKGTGIYFEDLGTTQLTSTEWKIVVYYNMNHYWEMFRNSQKGVQKLSVLTSSIIHNKYLKLIVSQYEHQLHELDEGNQIMFPNILYQRRRRRGLINVVGNIANKLFGVLDSEYASEIESKINDVKGYQNHLLQLIKNHTSMIEATTSLIKKSQENKLNQFKTLQEEIDKVINTRKEEEMIQVFLMLSNYISITLDEIRRIQVLLLNMVNDSHHGRFNSMILSPELLTKHLIEIKSNMPAEIQTPSISELYELITVKASLRRQYALFLLHVPLLYKEEYSSFRIIPFPTAVNGTFFQIKPQSEYLLINKQRDTAYSLSSYEFDNCASFEKVRICKQLHPLLVRDSYDLKCEFGLLSNQQVADECQIKVFKSRKFWIQLHQQNTWLYSFDKDYVFNIVCNKQQYQIKLVSSGIISFYDHCLLKDDQVTIQSFKTVIIREQISNQPIVNLSDELISNVLELHKFKLNHSLEDSIDIEVGKLEEEIEIAKVDESSIIPHLSKHNLHQYSISMASLILVLILGAISCARRCRRQPSIQPQQRQRSTEKEFNFDML